MAQPIATISQKDYLKKYLSGKNSDKQRKKKKHKKVAPEKRSIVVDDDDIKTMRALEDNELDNIFSLADDAPQIAGIIDERPNELRTLETFRSSARWKVIADEDGIEDVKVVAIPDKSTGNSDEDISPIRKNKYDSDESPQRGPSDSNESPQRSQDDRSTNRARTPSISPPRKQKEDHSNKVSETSLSRKQSRNDYANTLDLSKKGRGSRESPSRSKHSKRERALDAHKQHQPRDTEELNEQSNSHFNRNTNNYQRSNSDSDDSRPRKIKEEPQTPPKTHKASSRSRRKSSSDSDNNRSRKTEKVFKYNENYNKYTPQVSNMDFLVDQRKIMPAYTSKGSSKNRVDSDEEPPRKMKSSSSSQKDSRHRMHDSYKSPPGQNKNKEVYKKSRFGENLQESPFKKSKESRNQSDSDESPPRNKNRTEEAPRHSRNPVDSDTSPPRRNKRTDDSPRQSRKRQDLDESPPRKNKRSKEAPRESRKHVDSDESPPRRTKRTDNSPRQSRKHADSDESPPRKSKRSKEAPRESRKRQDSDESPPRKDKKGDYNLNQRGRQYLESDFKKLKVEDSHESSPRNVSRDNKNSQQMKISISKESSQSTLGKEPNKVVAIKTDKNAKQALGGDAAPIMRDRKTGRIRNLEEEARQKAEEGKKTDVQKEKYSRWGKGLVQVAATEVRLKDALHEMAKPVARYADDSDLDTMMRAQDREGDPMLEYMRTKSVSVAVASKPKYQGSWMPNRYNIPPGHRWDGVDRSSGYEKQWFDQANARRAMEEDAYKWSVADM